MTPKKAQGMVGSLVAVPRALRERKNGIPGATWPRICEAGIDVLERQYLAKMRRKLLHSAPQSSTVAVS
jgi:hypothetical protein